MLCFFFQLPLPNYIRRYLRIVKRQILLQQRKDNNVIAQQGYNGNFLRNDCRFLVPFNLNYRFNFFLYLLLNNFLFFFLDRMTTSAWCRASMNTISRYENSSFTSGQRKLSNSKRRACNRRRIGRHLECRRRNSTRRRGNEGAFFASSNCFAHPRRRPSMRGRCGNTSRRPRLFCSCDGSRIQRYL